MNIEQIAQKVEDLQQKVSAIEVWQDIGLKQLDESKNLSVEVGKLTVKIDNLISTLENQNNRLKNQDEYACNQLGINRVQELLIEKLSKKLDDLDGHIDELRMRGSKKLNFIVDKVIYVAVGIAVMYVLYRFGFRG